MEEPRWYTAVFVVSGTVAGQDDEPIFDLQYRLIQAVDDETAYQQALALGAQEAHSYRNSDGQTVSWVFEGLNDLIELDLAPAHGVEVFSRRVQTNARDLVVAKDQLNCFWASAHQHLTVREIVDGEPSPSTRTRAKAIQDAIGRVLMDDWDPIGIKDEPACHDEYDAYIGGVYRLLANRADAEEIAAHLTHVASTMMGIQCAPAISLDAAVKLSKINVRLDAGTRD